MTLRRQLLASQLDPLIYSKQMNTSTHDSKCPVLIASVFTGLLLAAAAKGDVVFQADFKGTNAGTGGAADMVTIGGTGRVQSDQVNTVTYVTNQTPFASGGGSYLQVNKISGGDPNYAPVLFSFASDANSWLSWQGADILGTDGNYYTDLHGAFDTFFRVDNGASTNDMTPFRPIMQESWSDGGVGFHIVMNGQSGGWLIVQLANSGFNLGVTPQAITNFTGSGGGASYDPLYDTINLLFNNSIPLTNGVPYHLAMAFGTDATGLITANLYLKAGTTAIDTNADRVCWGTFNMLSSIW